MYFFVVPSAVIDIVNDVDVQGLLAARVVQEANVGAGAVCNGRQERPRVRVPTLIDVYIDPEIVEGQAEGPQLVRISYVRKVNTNLFIMHLIRQKMKATPFSILRATLLLATRCFFFGL